MGTSATKAKRKWNKEHYTNVTAAMKPEMAAELKQRCQEGSKSVTSVITELVAEYLSMEVPSPKGKAEKKVTGNRRRRSRDLKEHIAAIESILDGEEEYLSNVPENLQGGIRYENASESIDHLRTALDELREVYPEGRI